MEKITEIFDAIDFTKLVPELDTLLGQVQTVTTVALLLGPVLMLLFGLWYLLLPPKEANYRAGFRTWFGMGSVEAWRFTQRLAGIVWGSLGLVLTVIMGILCLGFSSKNMMEVVNTAFICILCQAVLALISYLVICITCALRFKGDGKKR